MKKTLKISEDTHRRLERVGRKGETFDEIIKRLLPPERGRPGRSREREEKLEDLAELARKKKDEERKSGKLERTDFGWRVNFGGD